MKMILKYFPQTDTTERVKKLIELFVLVFSIPIAIFLFFRYEKIQNDLSQKKDELRIEIDSIQKAVQEINLESSKAPSSQLSSKIGIRTIQSQDGLDNLYEILISFSITNISDTENFIPFIIFETYKGVLKSITNIEGNIVRLNGPNEFAESNNFAGPVDWKLVRSDIGFYNGTKYKDIKNDLFILGYTNNYNTIPHYVGAVGYVMPKVTSNGEFRILSRASKNDYIGFKLIIPNKNIKEKTSEVGSIGDGTEVQKISTWEIVEWSRIANLLEQD